MFLCLKIGPEVGKVLNRDKDGNVENQMAPQRYQKRFFGSYLKTTRAITMKFGYIPGEKMLNPSTMSTTKKVSYHHSEEIHQYPFTGKYALSHLATQQ